MKEKILNPFGMAVCGLGIGVVTRLFDIYTEHLGKMFSQLAVWILLGVLIAVYSKTAVKAMWNLLPFCLGMLATYYAVASLTNGVYGKAFIIGWTVFALCSPVMGYLAWYAKEKGVLPVLLRVGIVGVAFLSSVVLFRGPRVYDLIIDGLLVYVLFFGKVKR